MEVVRGIGALALIFGAGGLIARVTGPVKYRASVNPAWMSAAWHWCGRVGLALCVIGGLLMLVSLI
jgi:hypothetical protein